MSGNVNKIKMDPNNNPNPGKQNSMDRHGPTRISPESMDRPMNPSPAPNPDLSCVCYRKTTGIFCFNCRYRKDNVRRRLTCPSHPNYLWLMDLPVCPKCQKDTHLTELT